MTAVIDIAGVKIGIKRMVLSEQFREFISSGAPDFTVDCRDGSNENLKIDDFWDERQEWNLDISRRNGAFQVTSTSQKTIPIGTVSPETGRAEFNDYSDQLRHILFAPFLRVCFQLFLTRVHGFTLHACGVVRDGKGYLFVGPSGSGKSTVASLRPADALLLSEEYVCLKKEGNSFAMHSTPWMKGAKASGTLRKVFFLNKAKEISFEKVSPSHCLFNLLPNVLYNSNDQELMNNFIAIASELAGQVDSYRMNFPIDNLIWKKIREADEIRAV